MTETCGECKSFPGMGYYCPIIGRFCDPNNEKPCEFFEKPFGRKITNGDKIIAGGMRAIAEFAKNRCQHCIYKNSDYIKTCLEVDCADGIEAWLNAPAESDVCVAQNAKNDTQTDLCCNDDTQDQEGKDE